ncbi:MAG: FkbM family methyltransferase [Alphaproteobacteria bacterium]|nr:FkbM family methyltransferase [Alphaproteobacteria bacterium]
MGNDKIGVISDMFIIEVLILIVLAVIVMLLFNLRKRSKKLKRNIREIRDSINNNTKELSNSTKAINTLLNIPEVKKVGMFNFGVYSMGLLLKDNPNVILKPDNSIEVYGIKFKYFTAFVLSEVFGRKDYEFGGLDGCIFIDVGANVADSTLYAASLPNVEYVYGYELMPSTYEQAKVNLSLNPNLAEKITLFNYGWYNKNSSMTTNDVVSNSGLNSIEDTAIDSFYYQRELGRSEALQVEVSLKESRKELLSILEKHPTSPIILKIDIEGAEYECLENMGNLIAHVDIILLEWHYRGYESIVELLEQNNFVWFHEILTTGTGYIKAYNTKKKPFGSD